MQLRLEDAIKDSKTLSYDGVIRSAYRSYQQSGDSAALYRGVNDYLSQKFSRSENCKAVFVSFWDPAVDANAYLLSSGTAGFELLQTCRDREPEILERMATADTDIRFLLLGENLYMARNLVDSHFEPYASVVMVLEPETVFRTLYSIAGIDNTQTRMVRISAAVHAKVFRQFHSAKGNLKVAGILGLRLDG